MTAVSAGPRDCRACGSRRSVLPADSCDFNYSFRPSRKRCPVKAALTLASGAGKYIDVGVVHISATNLAIIALMVVVFVLALIVPFPHGRDDDSEHKR